MLLRDNYSSLYNPFNAFCQIFVLNIDVHISSITFGEILLILVFSESGTETSMVLLLLHVAWTVKLNILKTGLYITTYHNLGQGSGVD